MKKLRVYLDTSVVSALYDEDKPERQQLTRDFFARSAELDMVISPMTLLEINATPNAVLRAKMLELVKPFTVLAGCDEVQRMVELYVSYGVLPPGKYADLLHIAHATVAGINYLLSWNFTHLVKIKTKAMVNMANIAGNYATIEIIPPPEV